MPLNFLDDEAGEMSGVIEGEARLRRRERGLAMPAAILLLLAAVIFLAGVLRLVRLGHFSLAQAAYCLAAIPAALLLLLIFDYTLHHARIAALMVIAMLAVFVIQSPAFCIGLGLALAGMVLMQDR